MSGKDVSPNLVLWVVGGLAVAYVVYKASQGLGAVSDAASAAADTAKKAGAYTWDVATGKEDPVGDAIGFHVQTDLDPTTRSTVANRAATATTMALTGNLASAVQEVTGFDLSAAWDKFVSTVKEKL